MRLSFGAISFFVWWGGVAGWGYLALGRQRPQRACLRNNIAIIFWHKGMVMCNLCQEVSAEMVPEQCPLPLSTKN